MLVLSTAGDAGGRKRFHGVKELFASDHYDWVSVNTIDGKCRVYSMREYQRLEAVSEDDFYAALLVQELARGFDPRRCRCFACVRNRTIRIGSWWSAHGAMIGFTGVRWRDGGQGGQAQVLDVSGVSRGAGGGRTRATRTMRCDSLSCRGGTRFCFVCFRFFHVCARASTTRLASFRARRRAYTSS